MSDDTPSPHRPNHPNGFFVFLALYGDFLAASGFPVPGRRALAKEASTVWKSSPPEFRDKFRADANDVRNANKARSTQETIVNMQLNLGSARHVESRRHHPYRYSKPAAVARNADRNSDVPLAGGDHRSSILPFGIDTFQEQFHLSGQLDNEANVTMHHHNVNAGGTGLTFPGHSNLAPVDFPQSLGHVGRSGAVGRQKTLLNLSDLDVQGPFLRPLNCNATTFRGTSDDQGQVPPASCTCVPMSGYVNTTLANTFYSTTLSSASASSSPTWYDVDEKYDGLL